jgi:hypothetical protein
MVRLGRGDDPSVGKRLGRVVADLEEMVSMGCGGWSGGEKNGFSFLFVGKETKRWCGSSYCTVEYVEFGNRADGESVSIINDVNFIHGGECSIG